MAMFKRMFLFFGVNILIIVTLSLVLNLLGIRPYLSAYGIDYYALMMFCLVWGMGGAFISLFISKWMAKTMMGVRIVDTKTQVGRELTDMVHSLSKRAGLSVMPEVGIYDSPEINAFATGPSRNNSLVAVSTGLLNGMSKDEIEGVVGHEVGHIANGDMVTMTLIQGVVNAFVMFLARIAAWAVGNMMRRDNDEGPALGGFAHIFVVMFFEIIFGILGSMLVAYFSRMREFRADKSSAKIAGRDKMISALRALERQYERIMPQENAAMSSLQISSKSKLGLLFSTHPPLADRIKALESNYSKF